ncbi:MAG: peptidylprolyl isomerase [Erythrobacter sp.]
MADVIHYRVKTDLGAFSLSLDLDSAPQTAGYFGDLFDAGVFDGSTVFRVVTPDNAEMRGDNPIDVIQFGHFDMDNNPKQRFEHEGTNISGRRHTRWAISAARGDIGQNYPSFFVCMRDEPALDFGGGRHPDGNGFAVFGEVTDGFDVLEALRNRAEDSEFLEQPIAIQHVYKPAHTAP